MMRWQLIDKITHCEPGVSAEGVKTFPRSDLIFMDHFPGHPIVPGVLQVEMIAQLAGKCAALKKSDVLPVLGTIKGAKFYRHVNPGDRCVIKVQIEKIASSYILASGVIEVDDLKVSSAQVLFGALPRGVLDSEDFDAVTQDWLKSQKAKGELK